METPTGNPPVQRRSCDWCHKQKLRCTRENNSVGGVCDRCARRRTPCVYSYSLPRGRPGLFQSQSSESTTSRKTSVSKVEETARRSPPTVPAPNMTRPGCSRGSSTGTVDSGIVMDSEPGSGLGINASHAFAATSTGSEHTAAMSFDASDFPDMNLDVDWSETALSDLCHGFDPNLSNMVNPQNPSMDFQQSPSAATGHHYDLQMADYSVTVCAVIGQLSQLMVRLSTLRSSGYELMKTVQGFSYAPQQVPLLDAASYEYVAGWLANGPANGHFPSGSSSPGSLSAGPDAPMLHQAFSASHRLLELLRCLEPYHSMTAAAPSSGSQILEHLLQACEAVLLEIYQIMLIALQCDANLGASQGIMILEDVRMVFAVQLCSYFINRQHQSIDACLASTRPGGWQQQMDPSSPQQLNMPDLFAQTPRSEVLGHLKGQVQTRLQHLRATLQCA